MTKKEVKEQEEVKGQEEAANQPPEGSYAALLKEAKESKRAVLLTPEYFEFKVPGMSLVGKYKGRSPVGGTEGKKQYYQYLLDTDYGLKKFHLGNITDSEAGAVMEEGCIYYIQFQGQENIPGGKRVNKFTIERIYTEEEARVGGINDKAF